MLHAAELLRRKTAVRALTLGLATVLLCGRLVGCGDDDGNGDEDEKPKATSYSATPPAGSTISPRAVVIMYFDNAPGSVTVNGTPAELSNRTATWQASSLSAGPVTLNVVWTNLDGSEDTGTLSYTVGAQDEVDAEPPYIVEATLPRLAGTWSTQVDPKLLESGITLVFSEAVAPGDIDIGVIAYDETTHAEEFVSLGWTAAWATSSVTIAPTGDSGALGFDQLCRISIQGVMDMAGNPLEETEIIFGTFYPGGSSSGKRVLR